ncbi:MAG: flavodoxin family protein [Methanomicrobiaceae archaeon]|nr:flavodoxin family protein [Methanomicrobiaceae archaeon]
MKILGISGSPRKNGNTDTILKEILRGAGESDIPNIETEALFLRDYVISPCTGCELCRKDLTCSRFNDGMNLIYPKIEEAEILVLGSPVYNYNVTSQMKSFIDRLYPYYIFSDGRPGSYGSRLAGKGKKALVFSVCEQTDPEETGFATEAMARPLKALGYHICRSFPICGFFDKGAVLKDKNILHKVYSLGMELAGCSDK